MKPLILALFSLFIIGCRWQEPEEHKGFMAVSDCYVYEYEVDSESLNDYRVEFIDMDEISGCKSQLENVYLLYDGEYYVKVTPVHPKEELENIQQLKFTHLSDTTRLSGYSRENNNVSVTIDRYHFEENHFYDWKYFFYTVDNGKLQLDSSQTVEMYPWSNKLRINSAQQQNKANAPTAFSH